MKNIKFLLLLVTPLFYGVGCEPQRVYDTATGYMEVANPTDTFDMGDTLHIVLHRPDSAYLDPDYTKVRLEYKTGDNYDFGFDFYYLDSLAFPVLTNGFGENSLIINDAETTASSNSFVNIKSNGFEQADLFFIMDKPGIYFLQVSTLDYVNAHISGSDKEIKARLTWYFETTDKQFYLMSPYKFQHPDSTWSTLQTYAQGYADEGRDGYAFAVKAK